MRLESLAACATAELVARPSRKIEITGITCDSRSVKSGDLFAALPGNKVDGLTYAKQAAERGAAAILCERPDPSNELPQLVCKDARLGLAQAARAFYGYPDRALKVG